MDKQQQKEKEKNIKELRFPFGENWAAFLKTINEKSISEAKLSIDKLVDGKNLNNKSFLDIGSGSGLFSLAAIELGAKVTSIDYDKYSIECAYLLKKIYCDKNVDWIIKQGSILDYTLVKDLGFFDVVYSWGVLHHTGNMKNALINAASMVEIGGLLVISIYNDQGHMSKIWYSIKRIYNKLPSLLRKPYVLLVMLPRDFRSLIYSLLTFNPSRYIYSWTEYRSMRGMSKWHDMIDWVGGMPFEVAKPEEIIFHIKSLGFELNYMTTCAGEIGCNEYVFSRVGKFS